MGNSRIRLLIADDNREICDILTHFFEMIDEVEVCGVAYDGEEALFRIAQTLPDVVLLDLIMPKADGLSVLERLSHAELAVRPHVIVVSAVGQEGFTRAALERGAEYYMIKPYDLSDLLSRVRMVAAQAGAAPAAPAAPPASARPEDPDTLIARAVMDLGLPPHMKGYQYVIAGVKLLLRENRPCSIVKEIYSSLALEYDTTPECVEGAIRKAIRYAWTPENAPMRAHMGEGENTPPSNGRFLNTLTQHIRLHLRNKKEEPG